MKLPVDPDNLPVGTDVNGYRVVRRLGGGGQGTAYQVEKGGEFFTLKMARHHEQSHRDSHQTDKRLQRELACLLVMRHPHIARVWAHGRYPHPKEGYLYLIMDYVEGCTLGEWLERHRVTPHELVCLMEKVFGAVAYMHRQGILHRDLKPGNILVDSQGEPVVVDYGAAHFPMGPRLTNQRLPPGTPRYTAPEAMSFEVEHRHNQEARYEFKVADELYALGVTLYDMLTDPQPWTNARQLSVGSPYYPPVLAHKYNPRVPVALSNFTARLMGTEPEYRPATMEAARRDLAEFVPLTAEEWTKWPFHPPPQAEPEPAPASSAEAGPPPVAPAPSEPRPAPAASSEAAPQPVPSAPTPQRRWVRAMATTVGLASLLACGAYLALRGNAPVSAPPSEVKTAPQPSPPLAPSAAEPINTAPAALPTPVPPQSLAPPEEASPVKPVNPSPPPPPSQCSQKKPPPRATPEWRSWCKCAGVVGSLAAFHAGCTGPQIRPASAPCSAEAHEAMDALGMERDTDRPVVFFDVSKEADEEEHIYAKEGPVTGVVKQGSGKLVAGSFVFGEFRVTTDRDGPILGLRYTQAQLPDGSKWPICLEGINPLNKNLMTAAQNPINAVDQWEWDIPWSRDL